MPRTADTPNIEAANPRVVRILTGPAINGPHKVPRDMQAVAEVLSDPVTRVEWDAVRSAGRDPMDWFARLPREQRVLPGATVAQGHGGTVTRFRVGPNVTLCWGSR